LPEDQHLLEEDYSNFRPSGFPKLRTCHQPRRTYPLQYLCPRLPHAGRLWSVASAGSESIKHLRSLLKERLDLAQQGSALDQIWSSAPAYFRSAQRCAHTKLVYVHFLKSAKVI